MSDSSIELDDPLFVAAWPGLGNVALGAAGFLLHALDFKPMGALRDADHFEDQRIQVTDGVIDPTLLPHGQFYGWKNPDGRDLLLFTSDAQPSFLAHRYCDELLEIAQRQGANRVLAFAGVSSEKTLDQPSPSKVFAVAGTSALRDVLAKDHGLTPLAEGELSGLNAVLLARASRRGMESMGLLGEVPAAGANLPYLKASLAVLEIFAEISGADLALEPLREQAEVLDERIRRVLERAKRLQKGDDPLGLPGPGVDDDVQVSREISSRIEALFLQAAEDRDVAYELKAELDAHGLFADYEDRFLDLFSPRKDPS